MIIDIPTQSLGVPFASGPGDVRLIPRITVKKIQEVVADYYRIPEMQMTLPTRYRNVARPRQVAMYLSRILLDKSYPDIGQRFGGRDHTTALYAVRKITALISGDSRIASDVAVLRDKLTLRQQVFHRPATSVLLGDRDPAEVELAA